MIIAQTSSGGGSGLGLLLPLLLLAGLYLLIVRPQRARMRQMRSVQRSLAPGARVITTAGLHATVVDVESDTVRLEIAPGVVATFAGQAVVRTLTDHDADDADDADDRRYGEPDPVPDPEASTTLPPPPDDPDAGPADRR